MNQCEESLNARINIDNKTIDYCTFLDLIENE